MIQYSWLIPTLPALAYVVIIVFTRPSKALSAGLSILTMGACFVISVGVLFDLLHLEAANRVVYICATWLQI
jgi:NADH:ubiquinone oxidoreductase subunit 5 (subunit L)/multisubunit Na+/H+ antiporter MnhA subunit